MSGRQQLRLFIQGRLTAAAEEIFGVLEKTMSEYEEQVVQSKREVDQLKQDIRHLNNALNPCIRLYRIDSQQVSEKLYQELMLLSTTSSQTDVGQRQQSPHVKEEQMDLSIVPDQDTNVSGISNSIDQNSETSISNMVTNGCVDSRSIVSRRWIKKLKVQEKENKKRKFGHYADHAFCIEHKICRFCRKPFHRNKDLIQHVRDSHNGLAKCDAEIVRLGNWDDHYLTPDKLSSFYMQKNPL